MTTHRKPKTPAEVLRFQDGIWKELHHMEWILETFRQVTSRSSDAMTDYEEALRSIAKSKVDKESARLAAAIIKKYRF